MSTEITAPVPGSDHEILSSAAQWVAEGRRVALATVVRTWGSSPRPVGSLMAIDETRRVAGSVSGGCVEGAVIEAAVRVIDSGGPESLEFRVTRDEAWAVGLACGGSVRVWVEPLPAELLLCVLSEVGTPGRTVVCVSEMGGFGRRALISFDSMRGGGRSLGMSAAGTSAPFGGEVDVAAEALRAASEDRTTVVEDSRGGPDLLFRVHGPSLRMILVGAVHIAQHLAPMGRSAGFGVVVVDPRATFATEERFPGTRLVRSWPTEALVDLRPDRRTAVVALTHDSKFDDPSLLAALAGSAFYVGALGSRRTHRRRLERLAKSLDQYGLDLGALKRIRGPVGLDIGARTPAEIAVAILAEAVRDFRVPWGPAVHNVCE